ncbi:MAG: PTS sugar transporter subunit IIB [Candidatus Nanopelagicales bacterium]
MKIIAVCGMGIGTSILLKINADKALERLGLSGEVEAADAGMAKGAVRAADLVLTSAEKAPDLDGLGTSVRVINDFMDVDEIVAAISEVLNL